MERAVRQPTVLVVEDEVLIRMSITDALEDAGFIVIEAGDSGEAIRLFDAEPDIQAIVTDVHMPGPMDGFMFARHAQSLRPDVKALIVSGRFLPAETELSHARRFLSKPYRFDEVIETLVDMMGAPPRSFQAM